MLSVLHCIPTLSVGGAERQLRLLAPRLAARGLEIAVFSRLSAEDEQSFASQGVRCFPIRAAGNHDPARYLQLRAVLRSFAPQIVQSWLPQMDILCGLLRKPPGLKWVLAERSSPMAYDRSLKNRLRFRLGRGADLIVANSVSGLSVWPGRPATVIPNGIDLEEVDATPAGFYARSAPMEGRKIVLSLSRLSSEKRIGFLIEAVKRARREEPALLLVVAGDGPEREPLGRIAAAAGMEAHVHFAGYQSDPVRWMKSADMFASASAFEGHPNAVLEAAAARTPLVLSDIPQHRQALGAGLCLVPPGDPDVFADAIVRVIRSAELRQTLTASARREVEAISADRIADAYLAAYRSLTGPA